MESSFFLFLSQFFFVSYSYKNHFLMNMKRHFGSSFLLPIYFFLLFSLPLQKKNDFFFVLLILSIWIKKHWIRLLIVQLHHTLLYKKNSKIRKSWKQWNSLAHHHLIVASSPTSSFSCLSHTLFLYYLNNFFFVFPSSSASCKSIFLSYDYLHFKFLIYSTFFLFCLLQLHLC